MPPDPDTTSRPGAALTERKATRESTTIIHGVIKAFSESGLTAKNATNLQKLRHCNNHSVLTKSTNIPPNFTHPRWLINRAWSLHAVYAASGWTFKPRMMNVIPEDSKLFRCAERGDVQGIRELFASREASPFDCTSHGLTVLHSAASSSVGLCRFLIEQGADASYHNSVWATTSGDGGVG